MLRTRLCDLLGIDVPIILAGMGAGATSAEFAAAVSNEGGLGSVGSLFRSADVVKRDIDLLPTLTNRNFAVESFRHTLRARPAVISFALDDPGDLIRQAHDVGSRVMLQVTTVAQAIQAAEHGVDVIIAQGTEAGGYGGAVSTMALVPQIVDAVSPVPVVAAGGIYDGRGIAAALMLGAVGVNMGTRFLASQESPIDDDWKQAIIEARSEDAVKAEVINDIIPVPGTVGYGTVGRTLRTPFLDEWGMKRDEARRNGARLWAEIGERLRRGQRRETLVWAGQTAGGVREILTVAEIMRQLVDQTEAALARAPGLQ